MPAGTRNVAVSLGKINGKNNDPEASDPGNFNDPGERWQDWDLFGLQFKLSASKYTVPGEFHLLFRRKVPSIFFNPFATGLNHQVQVSNMSEIDNSAGSYMNGIGNFIAVCDWTYFLPSQIWNGKNFYTHKSVVSALAINEGLWPSDHSMSVDLQELGLMFNGYNSINQLRLSNHYGYPHLGRPVDHFEITPFEAIYIDDKIDPHIELKDSDESDKDSLNNFLYNEAEPWYLGLQNETVGAQARVNYEYYVRRRARNVITMGHLVTPSTDPGDYIALTYSRLDLRAGDAIIMKPGTNIQAGSNSHFKIEYIVCGSSAMGSSNNSNPVRSDAGFPLQEQNQEEVPAHEPTQNSCSLFPNPSSDGTFTVKSVGEVINELRIFSTTGLSIYQRLRLDATEVTVIEYLPVGTYIVQVNLNDRIETFKLVVL